MQAAGARKPAFRDVDALPSAPCFVSGPFRPRFANEPRCRGEGCGTCLQVANLTLGTVVKEIHKGENVSLVPEPRGWSALQDERSRAAGAPTPSGGAGFLRAIISRLGSRKRAEGLPGASKRRERQRFLTKAVLPTKAAGRVERPAPVPFRTSLDA